ncbi:MAG: hypothetical protein HY343_05390 [Lentisphaerae bacterium]|nr:hypothetical protein [Lentisphaerota bacterium]
MIRRVVFPVLAILWGWTAAGAPPASTDASTAMRQEQKPAAVESTNNTVITSKRLNFESATRMAVFEENVVVTDPEMKMTADLLTVYFDEQNKVKGLEAEGRVVLIQKDGEAHCDKASYDVKGGKVVMTGNPRVKKGADTLEGGRITWWRDTNRLQVEMGTHVTFQTDEDKRRDTKQNMKLDKGL